jgi:hypothetical protein
MVESTKNEENLPNKTALLAKTAFQRDRHNPVNRENQKPEAWAQQDGHPVAPSPYQPELDRRNFL